MMVELTRDCIFFSQMHNQTKKIKKGTVTKLLDDNELAKLPRDRDGMRIRSEIKRHKENHTKGAYVWLGGKWRFIYNEDYRVLG